MIAHHLTQALERVRLGLGQGRGTYIGSLAASQVAPLISAPIVSRMYSPEDFGVYAVFYSLVTVLASISSLALHNAILLRDEGEPSFHAVILSLMTTGMFSFVLFLGVFFFGKQLASTFNESNILSIVYFLPLTVFLNGISMCITSWAVRCNRFSLLARNKIILAISTAVFQILIGLIDAGAVGFVIANIFGIGLSIILLSAPFVKSSRQLKYKPSIAKAIEALVERKTIVYWMLPANLVSSCCNVLPELLIGRYFGVMLLGQFTLANRMLNFPVAFISAGVQDIFRQQAVAQVDSSGTCRSTFWRFLFIQAGLAIILIMPVILIIPYVFPIIFGAQWTEAGNLIQAVAFLTVVRFISSPISYVWIIQGQQRLDFLWQLGLLGLSLGTLIQPPLLDPKISLYTTLWIYSLVVGAWYVLAIAVSYRLSGHPRRKLDTETSH